MRVLITALIASLGLALATSSAFARSQDPFTVRSVPIDATADNTFEAQAEAMRQGQRRAAARLFQRLVLPEDLFDHPIWEMSDGELAELIAGIEVLDEQRSATRYLARLNVSFDPRAVERVMDGFEIDFVRSQARRALVVPVIERNGRFVLWSGGNAWLEAWENADFANELTPFFAPERNVGGSVIDADAALSLYEPGLRALADYYGVGRVAVLRARIGEARETERYRLPFDDQREQGGPVDPFELDEPGDSEAGAGAGMGSGRTEVRFGGYIADFTGPEMVISTWGPETASGDFSDATRMFVRLQQDEWKRAAIVRDGQEAQIQVTVLYGGLGEWRGLQDVLAGAALIDSAQLDAMSRDGALMTLSYRGEQAQLIAELYERGAALEEHPGLGWVVRAAR